MEKNWVIAIYNADTEQQEGWLGDRWSIQLPCVSFDKVKMINSTKQVQGTLRRLREQWEGSKIFRAYEAKVELGEVTDY